MTRTRTFIAQATLAAALAIGTAGAFAQTYTKQQLQETYTGYLAQEGFRPELTSGGNVRFRREGRTYAIFIDERDPTFFRLQLSFSAEDKSPAMRLKRLEGVNAASGDAKVIKAYLDGDGDPTFAAELFVVVPGDFKTHLARLFRALDNAYEKYTAKVQSMN